MSTIWEKAAQEKLYLYTLCEIWMVWRRDCTHVFKILNEQLFLKIPITNLKIISYIDKG